MARVTRLERATFCVTGRRSNQTELRSQPQTYYKIREKKNQAIHLFYFTNLIFTL